MTVPERARAVVVGGGIVGCSVAYHLAGLGWNDVVVLERHQLTSGSTFHAAGLVGQLRANANITQLLGQSIDLYRRLEAETGQATGWKMNGGLRLACDPQRWEEVKRQATTATSFGLEMHLLSPREAAELWPLMTVDDVLGAAFLPTDGQANPSDITMALGRGTRQRGGTICEHTGVARLEVSGGRIAAVHTTAGQRIECEVVVLCAGQWTRQLAATIGVSVPLVSVEHQYVITADLGAPRTLPTLRDPDRLTYYKEEVGGLVMGGYEPNPKPWAAAGVPDDFHFRLLDADWEHFAPTMELAIGRVPALAEVGINQLINGPESFTPDGNFILGEAPEVGNVFVGAGFNAFGIAAGGGAGKALAEWIVGGTAPYDLWPVDIRRLGPPHRDLEWVRARTLEAYAKHYTMSWPHEEHRSARPTRRSPLYDRLAAAGACFGEKLGWERPNWFADAALGERPVDRYSYGRQNWFAAVGREHRAIRTAVGVTDQTSFAKFELRGRGAADALSWLCANEVGGPVGSLTYTQMLDERGGIQADVTVARLDEDRFYLTTGTAFATHDRAWIESALAGRDGVEIVEVTEDFAVLAVMGPHSRAVLTSLSDADLSNAAFPFGQVRTIDVAGRALRALRVTYVGELGWELHVPIADAPAVFDALHEAGAAHGLANVGYRAIESCRLEKGYRAWGVELGPDHTPFEAGLGWAVKLASGTPFLGRDAVQVQLQRPLTKLLAGFSADPDVVLLGRETIYRNGERVGWLACGGFGYTVQRSLGYGYVRRGEGLDRAWVEGGEYELEVATRRVPCTVTLRPWYDPTSVRVKA